MRNIGMGFVFIMTKESAVELKLKSDRPCLERFTLSGKMVRILVKSQMSQQKDCSVCYVNNI